MLTRLVARGPNGEPVEVAATEDGHLLVDSDGGDATVDIEMQATETHLQYRTSPDGEWRDLIALEELNLGPTREEFNQLEGRVAALEEG